MCFDIYSQIKAPHEKNTCLSKPTLIRNLPEVVLETDAARRPHLPPPTTMNAQGLTVLKWGILVKGILVVIRRIRLQEKQVHS